MSNVSRSKVQAHRVVAIAEGQSPQTLQLDLRLSDLRHFPLTNDLAFLIGTKRLPIREISEIRAKNSLHQPRAPTVQL